MLDIRAQIKKTQLLCCRCSRAQNSKAHVDFIAKARDVSTAIPKGDHMLKKCCWVKLGQDKSMKLGWVIRVT